MAFPNTDELLVVIVPFFVYWGYSGMYALLGNMDKYRLHPKEEEDTASIPSSTTVIKGVLVAHAQQFFASIALYMLTGNDSGAIPPQPSLFIIICQLLTAMVALDTYQYFMHRLMHTNKFLTRIHSTHHKLVVPYCYGALYGHPLDGFLLDVAGSGFATLVSGMTPRTTMYFFCFSAIKTVDDHCGLLIPGNPFQRLFRNNSAYHYVHHQLYGNKYNFSQPFFVHWDKLFGTYMPYSVEKRKAGGFVVRPQIKTE